MSDNNSTDNNVHADVASLKKGLEAQENNISQLRDIMTQRFTEISEAIQNVQSNNNNNNNNNTKQTGLISLFIAALAAVATPIGITLSFQQNAFSSYVRESKEARENIREDYAQRDSTIIENQNDIRERVDELETNLSRHQGMASVRFNEMDDQIDELDKTINNEITSTQNLLSERIQNLDTVLQREMRLLDNTSQADVKALRQQIENLQTRLRVLEMMRNGLNNNRQLKE